MARRLAAIVVASPTRNVTRLLAYALNRKPGQTGDRYVVASGLNGAIPEVAAAQYRDNRKHHGKNGERQVQVADGKGGMRTVTEGAYVQGYHLIQSFARDGAGALDPADPAAWEEAHRLGRKLARRLAGVDRMAVVVTQIDGTTGCIHNHIVTDSIDRHSGKSFASSNVKHSVLAATHDEVLAEAGYEQVNALTSTAAERREPSEERARLRHEQWVAGGEQGPEPFSVAVMKDRIREAMADPRSTSFDAYAEVLRERGVVVDVRGEQDRGLTYSAVLHGADGEPTEPTRASRRRASKLGRRYMRPAVDEVIERHAEQARQAAVQPASRPTFDDLAAVASGTVHDRAAALASSMTLPPAAALGPRLQLPTEPPAAPRRATPSRTAQPVSPHPHAAARQARIEAMEAATQQRLAAAEAERAVLVRQMAEEDEREAQQEPTSTPAPALAPLPPEPPADTRSAPVVDEEQQAPRPSFAEQLAAAQRRQDELAAKVRRARGQEVADEPQDTPAPLAAAPGEPGDARSAPAVEEEPRATTEAAGALAPLPPAAEKKDGEEDEIRSAVDDVPLKRARDRDFRDRVSAMDKHVQRRRRDGELLMNPALFEGMTVKKVSTYWGALHEDTQQVLEWKDQMAGARNVAYIEGDLVLKQRLEAALARGEYYAVEVSPRPNRGGSGGHGGNDRQPGE